MSRIKISENLFLEVNELNKFVSFIKDDGYKKIIKPLIKSYGIVKDDNNSNFKVTKKSGSSNTVIINSGLAFDNNLDAIVSDNNLEMVINNTGVKCWIILSRGVSNLEIGTVTVSSDGSLSGTSTKFKEVLRGQPNFPVKVKFNSTNNIGEYEVIKVLSDTYAILSGSLISEASLKYSVIGTFTPGFQPSQENKQIYEYDSYSISVIDSDNKPNLEEGQFILASIEFSIDEMTVTDERINYMFNGSYSRKGDSNFFENSLVSLMSVNTIGGINSVNTVSADFELIIEHGYKINSHALVVNSSTNILSILNGSCNFLGSGNIPNDLFSGWILFNRKNMKYAVIDGNTNKDIYISNLDSDLMNGTDNELIIVPDFKEIEYEITVSSNVDSPAFPFYHKNSICNKNSRIRFYAYMPSVSESFSDSVTVSIKYRMLDDSGNQYPFLPLSVAQFINIKGQYETLSDSSFDINLADIEPQEKQRNYS